MVKKKERKRKRIQYLSVIRFSVLDAREGDDEVQFSRDLVQATLTQETLLQIRVAPRIPSPDPTRPQGGIIR